MREIKFRGRRVDNGEWVSGSLMQFKDGVACIMPPQIHDAPRTILFYEVDAATVGECLALKDRNSIEIYEGDVVEDTEGNRAVVKYGESSCGCCGRVHGFYNDGPHLYWDEFELCTVIGNIYQNPNLLNEPNQND